MEVSTTDQGNDKVAEALGTLEQLQSRDDSEIARLWAEGEVGLATQLT